MDAARLALILTVLVVCVLVATRPEPRRVRRSGERTRTRRPTNGACKHRLRAIPGIATQRNHWDRSDLDRAIGRDFDDIDGSVSAWPSA